LSNKILARSSQIVCVMQSEIGEPVSMGKRDVVVGGGTKFGSLFVFLLGFFVQFR